MYLFIYLHIHSFETFTAFLVKLNENWDIHPQAKIMLIFPFFTIHVCIYKNSTLQ